MWDSVYEFLFNPNHEMPISALLVIGAMSIILNTWVQKEGERRRNSQNHNYSAGGPARSSANKKKKRSKKK